MATAAELFMTSLPDAITKEQLATLFRKALLGHEAKLDRIAAFAPGTRLRSGGRDGRGTGNGLELSGRL
ncbi:hypothetical protein [Methylobacterium sp. R2-1]|uniref:hypothetical protein n=1 Tax=Methylobacterium sp. R2-1 TaxID=2587064 RepID=UPI00160B9046|nr:hypothetical protein [Methylobacterium sp. R2-1]MBB2962617.1 hypothetical protein [Methylobacterium sp. R2-1]